MIHVSLYQQIFINHLKTKNMKTINKVEIQGFLGRDAEEKTFESGRTLISMSLATDESYKNNKGEWLTNTTWHNVTYWKNKKDENTDFLKKGELISVTGKLNTRKYTDKNSQERYITEVVAYKMEPVKEEA
jgi:single-strand DNA-binding protein